MEELKGMLEKIQELRDKLNSLIDEKNDLLDTEIINASKKLDAMLNEYEKVIKDKNKKSK